MLEIKNVSLHAFCVALRWAGMSGRFPNNVREWTLDDNLHLQNVANEIDRRARFRKRIRIRHAQIKHARLREDS